MVEGWSGLSEISSAFEGILLQGDRHILGRKVQDPGFRTRDYNHFFSLLL